MKTPNASKKSLTSDRTHPVIRLPESEPVHPTTASSITSGEAIATAASNVFVSHKSCSTFCAGADDGMDLWLAERYAYRIKCEEIKGDSPVYRVIRDEEEVKNINSRVKEYRGMCQSKPYWPSEWKTIVNMLDLPDVYKSTGVTEYLYEHHVDSTSKTTDGFKNVLVSHFHDLNNSILDAALNQRFRDLENRVVPEAQVRSPWDNIVKYFSVSEKDNQSVLISLDAYLEKQLNCSCNEMIVKHGQGNSLRDEVEKSLKFSSDYWMAMDETSTVATEAWSIYNRQLSIEDDDAMMKATQKQAMQEPMTGKCDFTVCLPILADSLNVILGDDAGRARKLLESGRLVIDKFIGKMPPVKNPQTYLQVPSQPAATPTTSDTGAHLKELRIPSIGKIASLLPLVVGEYKKDHGEEDKVAKRQAENQATVYCVSSVAFLGHLGIKDFLVYGLVGLGQKGQIIAAWKSSVTNKTYILKEDIWTFDLHNSVDALGFAFFLWRVRNENGSTLQGLFNERIKEIMDLGAERDSQNPKWTKEAEDKDNAYRQNLLEQARKEKEEKDLKEGKKERKGRGAKTRATKENKIKGASDENIRVE